MNLSASPVPASIVTVLPPDPSAGGGGARFARTIVPPESLRPIRGEGHERHVRSDPRETPRRDNRPSAPRAVAPAFSPPVAPPGDEYGRASAQFLVQALTQDEADTLTHRLSEHRDGAGLGAIAYRRAGAEPILYSEQPTVFRISA